MPQIVLDLRIFNAYRWTSAVIIYDETLGNHSTFVNSLGPTQTPTDRDMITRVVTSLTKETSDLGGSVAVSIIKLQTNGSALNFRETIRSTLASVSVKTVGRNFLAIVGIEVVEVLMEYAKTSGLAGINNQWLYVISDANRYKMDVAHLRKLLKEGDNVAFIYNTTSSNVDCVVS